MLKATCKTRTDVSDVLRFLATFFVFTLHCRSSVGETGIEGSFLGQWFCMPAWSGVWIFFFLSSYLFALNMRKGKYGIINSDGKLVPRKLLGYYGSRFKRFVPIYFLYMILFDLFTQGEWVLSNPKPALLSFLFLFNGLGGVAGIGHLWYISTAIQLYLAMPLLFWFLAKLIRRSDKLVFPLFLATLLIGFAWRNIAHMKNIDWYTWVYTFWGSNIDLICCGILAAFIADSVKFNGANRALSVVLFLMLVLYNVIIYAQEVLAIYRYILPSVYILTCTYLVAAFKPDKRARGGVFNVFSKYSYGFYVFHIASFMYTETLFSRIGFDKIETFDVRYGLFLAVSAVISMSLSVIFTDCFAIKSRKK